MKRALLFDRRDGAVGRCGVCKAPRRPGPSPDGHRSAVRGQGQGGGPSGGYGRPEQTSSGDMAASISPLVRPHSGSGAPTIRVPSRWPAGRECPRVAPPRVARPATSSSRWARRARSPTRRGRPGRACPRQPAFANPDAVLMVSCGLLGDGVGLVPKTVARVFPPEALPVWQFGQPRRRHTHALFPLQPVAQLGDGPCHPRPGRGVQQRIQPFKAISGERCRPSRSGASARRCMPPVKRCTASRIVSGLHSSRSATCDTARPRPSNRDALQTPPLVTRQIRYGQLPDLTLLLHPVAVGGERAPSVVERMSLAFADRPARREGRGLSARSYAVGEPSSTMIAVGCWSPVLAICM